VKGEAMKEAYIDVETGGLDPKKNALLQLSGTIMVGGRKVDEFNYFIQPHPGDILEDEALSIGGFDRTEIGDPDGRFKPPKTIHRAFTRKLSGYVDKFDKYDKFFFIGYNCHSFDSPFVREWFFKCGDKFYGSYFFHPPLDVMLIATWDLRYERHTMKNFKLQTVAEHLGIPLQEKRLHDALYDVEITKNILDELVRRKQKI